MYFLILLYASKSLALFAPKKRLLAAFYFFSFAIKRNEKNLQYFYSFLFSLKVAKIKLGKRTS